MDTTQSLNNQDINEVVELRGAKVWRRGDGITQIQIQNCDTLEASDVVDMVSTVYQLNVNQEGSLILIQTQEDASITKAACFLLSCCSHIVAAAIITKKSFSNQIIHKFFRIGQKNYPFRAFTSSKSGLSWLSQFS